MDNFISYTRQLATWIQAGINNNYSYILIVKDLEDKDYFPVYFVLYSDCERYSENIISESKIKIIELIKLSLYKKI